MNQQQRAVVQQALEAFDVLTMNDYSGYECSKHETDKIDAAQAALRQLLEQPEPVQEPVAAQQRFRHPQKTMPGWSAWQPASITNRRPPWEIDSQGYEVEYRLLYTTPPIVPTPLAQQANKS
jgi:hypothetical protein